MANCCAARSGLRISWSRRGHWSELHAGLRNRTALYSAEGCEVGAGRSRIAGERAALQRLADFPVMAEWIDHAAQPPSIIVLDRHDDFCTRRHCTIKSSVRVGHREHHARGAAVERLGTEVV